jgi:hypothetical protein
MIKTFSEWKATEEMKDFFQKRTNMHIELVQKWAKKIQQYDDKFSGLVEQTEEHDASKFEEPEYTPYLFITWSYKCKAEEKNFEVPKDIKEKMSLATEHHVKSNRHHPEFHSTKEVDLINREDRDKPPQEMIDATSMPWVDLGEMVSDWFAMSNEKKTDPQDWADKNINVRWQFTDEQVNMIYDLIADVYKAEL